MFDHALDYLKGWPHESGVDFDAHLSPNVTLDPVYGGSVVHLNPEGLFELGAGGRQMPMFLNNGTRDLDVNNDGGTQWYAIAPTKKLSALVASGAYELETTEFYADSNVVYTPGDILHSPTEAQVYASTKIGAGMLYKSRAYLQTDAAFVLGADNICGVVSRRRHINAHRRDVISFHPVYFPGTVA
jgi:hypothetical protein